jgi:hypothetical protein
MATEIVDLTIVGCQPVVSSTRLEFGVTAERVYTDGWSGARSTGWSPTRVHMVVWDVLSTGAVAILRHQLERAQDIFGDVFIEIVGRDPLIGRISSMPEIRQRSAALWSAIVTVEENR